MANVRPVLVHPDRVRALFNKMRDELHELAAKHLSENHSAPSLPQSVAHLTSFAVSRWRGRRRKRRSQSFDLLRAFAAERDPAAPLN